MSRDFDYEKVDILITVWLWLFIPFLMIGKKILQRSIRIFLALPLAVLTICWFPVSMVLFAPIGFALLVWIVLVEQF